MPHRPGRRRQLPRGRGRGCYRAAPTLRSASSRGSAAMTVQSSGPRSAPGQREAQRAEVAADGLQLADDRARTLLVEAAVRAGAQLGEPCQRRTRRLVQRGRPRARGSTVRLPPPRAGRARRGAPARARPGRRRAAPAPRRAARRSRRPRAAGAAARRGGRRAAAGRARRGTRARPRAGTPASRSAAIVVSGCSRFESLCPSGPSTSPWWTNTGGSAPSASNSVRWKASLSRWSPPRTTCVIPKSTSSTTLASWYVGEPSARRSVRPPKSSAPASSRSVPDTAAAASR